MPLTLSLTGCSQNDTNKKSDTSQPDSSQTPTFTGPYATEFGEYYNRAQTDFAREVLADSVITESEYEEARNAQKTCLEGRGYKVTLDDDSITLEPNSPKTSDETVNGDMTGCSKESGIEYIEALYSIIKRNPNNEDWDQLNVDCLIREGVVEPGFTKADLAQWYENDDPRLRTGGEADKCTIDPLGLLNN